jgi:hypothetical protein
MTAHIAQTGIDAQTAATDATTGLYYGYNIAALEQRVATRPVGYYAVLDRAGGGGLPPECLRTAHSSSLPRAQEALKKQLDRGRVEGSSVYDGKHYVYSIGKFAPFTIEYRAILADGTRVAATPEVQARPLSDSERWALNSWKQAQETASAAAAAGLATGERDIAPSAVGVRFIDPPAPRPADAPTEPTLAIDGYDTKGGVR